MCGVLPAHRRAGLYWRYAAQGHYSALAGCAGAPIAANEAADPDRDRARTPGAGLPCQETRRPTTERATAGTVARQDRWDDVGRRGGRPLVERAPPVAGVGIRGGYALNRRRPARYSAASDGGSPTSLLPHAGQNAATRSTSQKLARPPITYGAMRQ